MKKVVVCLTGPSCSGKSFLERALAEKGFGRAISTTTRLPRAGEQCSRDYYFATRERFEFMRSQGQFVEAVEFGGHLYGMTVEEMGRALEPTGCMVVVAEPNGAGQIREFCDEHGLGILSVWVACDVQEQARRFVERIPQMKPEAVASRLATMLSEEQTWRQSANVGRIVGWPYRYHLEMWKAGPELQDVYVEGVVDAVKRLQGGSPISFGNRRFTMYEEQ